MMSRASAAKVGTPSTLTPSAAIPSLIVGERRCAVAKSNLKRRNVFRVIFVRRRFWPWWGLQTTSLFLLQQRLALSTFQWNKRRFLKSKSLLPYLVVEKKVSSLKLVSTESVISLNLVQHPRPGKDQDWFELKKPNQVLYCFMASVTIKPCHIGDASWSWDRHPKIDHIWHWGVTEAGQQ